MTSVHGRYKLFLWSAADCSASPMTWKHTGYAALHLLQCPAVRFRGLLQVPSAAITQRGQAFQDYVDASYHMHGAYRAFPKDLVLDVESSTSVGVPYAVACLLQALSQGRMR